MHIIDLKQGNEEWLSFRKKSITATDLCAIMQVSKWVSPYQLWQQKLDLVPPTKMNEKMQRGIDLEPIARNCFCKLMEIEMEPSVIQHDMHEYFIASLDGVCLYEDIAVEIKCGGLADHNTALSGKVPDHYYPQVQWQLYVTGFNFMYYFSYKNDEDYTLVKVYRDDPYIEKMVKKAHEFYEMIMHFEPPEMTDKDYQKIESDEFAELAAHWKFCHERKKLHEENEKIARDNLIKYTNGQSSIGSGLRLSKYVSRGRVDYEKIINDYKINEDEYRKPASESWRVTEL